MPRLVFGWSSVHQVDWSIGTRCNVTAFPVCLAQYFERLVGRLVSVMFLSDAPPWISVRKFMLPFATWARWRLLHTWRRTLQRRSHTNKTPKRQNTKTRKTNKTTIN